MDDALGNLLKGIPSKKSEEHDLSGGAVTVREQHPPRFDLDTDRSEFLAYLEEHGYAVVAGAADVRQIDAAKSLMWDYLEGIPNTQVSRDDVRSWGLKGDWMPSETNGILHGFGFGQSDFMWHLRLLPRVKAAFSAIWNTDDLIVSFDGGNAFRPWTYTRSWLTIGGWYHVDQNATKSGGVGRVCIQGFVTLLDATGDTGGLVVVPGSHKQHSAMCLRSKKAKAMGDYIPVPVGDPILEKGACLICARAGDLVLWDSRTVHCNTPALTALYAPEDDANECKSPEELCGSEQATAAAATSPVTEQWDLIRQVGYVCMTPAKFASQETLSKREDAFVNNVSTSHWPHKMVMGGHALPDTPLKDPTAISQEQRALIGYDRPCVDSHIASTIDDRPARLCTVM